MTEVIFAVAFAALLSLIGLLVLTIYTELLKIWPVPREGSWESYTFWPLFRCGLGLTMLLGVWQFATAPSHGIEALVGVPLAFIALAATIYGYFDLGIDNTYGADEQLVTTGLYRYSRNPQYVTSIIGFIGLAIAVGTAEVITLSTLAIIVYSLLPFAEEPWLEHIYGEAYHGYARTTPRFFSVSKLFQKPATAER